MSPAVFWFLVWLLTATAVALVVGRAVRLADEMEDQRTADRAPLNPMPDDYLPPRWTEDTHR